jgi:hypothetical protein
MSRYAIKFPFRVRIHGGEFDESARAIHREDGLKTIQAESGIVLESTIERKQMSTKTTFKRIALVTVAALGFGVMSVAPSNAAAQVYLYCSTADGGSIANSGGTTYATNGAACNGVAGIANNVTLTTVVSSTKDVLIVTSAGVLSSSATGITVATGGGSATLPATTASGAIKLTTPTAGTITVSVYTAVAGSGIYSATAAETVTITVLAAAQSTVVSATTSTSYLIKGETVSSLATGAVITADAAVTASATAATTSAVATIKVTIKDALSVAANDSITATITSPTGAGSIVSAAVDVEPVVNGSTAATSAAADAGGLHNFYVFANGFAGVATITIKAGTTVIATETVTFVGVADAYTVAATSTAAPGANIGVADTAAFKVTAKDAAGNLVVDGSTIYAVSGTPANATVTASATTTDGIASFTVTGVLSGDSVITFGNAATVATMTKSVTKTVSVVKTTFKTLTVTMNKTVYEPGEKMTLTFTALDSNGKGIADGSRSILNAGNGTTILAAGFNVSVVSVVACPTTTATFLAGVATCVVYAPSTGTVTFSGSTGTADDAVVTLATAVTAVSATASVNNAALTASQEATDAANEATDAGNNAKDAADQAIEAADAATIAAQDAAAAAEAAGEMAVEAAEAAGAIAQDALDAANAATDAALSAAEAADAATAAATEAKESADAATAAVAELSTKVAALMAALNAKVTTLSNLVAKIAKKVKA